MLANLSFAQKAAAVVLIALYLAAIGAGWIAPAPFDKQFREAPGQGPSRQFVLGTDDLGRDRFSRLLYGSRISLSLAPAAALLATILATLIGATAALAGGWWDRVIGAATDLSLSLPWLFFLITVRAALPLDVSPQTSLAVTFLLLGLLGWAGPARVIRATLARMRSSGFVLQARSAGCSQLRILFVHMLPNLRPILITQFIIAVPVFILSEANLGLLGLGVSEPMPSWGNLLRDLENLGEVSANPWMLAPVALLILVVVCLQLLAPREDFSA